MKLLVTAFVSAIAVCPLFGQKAALSAAAIYKRDSASVFVLYVRGASGGFVAQGSGFLIAGGRIVTNAHVADLGKVYVQLGPARVPTRQLHEDEESDLAILGMDAELGAAPLALAAGAPAPGERVFVISNPEGLERSISDGIVSGDRKVGNRDLLQITAPISHGSSGGPVFNAEGRVVGVADAFLANGENLNFAVPVSSLKKLLAGEAGSAGAFAAILARVKGLGRARSALSYSADPSSAYAQESSQIDDLLSSALTTARNDAGELVKVSAEALRQGDSDTAVTAARRAVGLAPSARTHLELAYALDARAGFFAKPDSPDLAEAGKAALAAIADKASSEEFAELGNIYRERGEYARAVDMYKRGLPGDTAERQAQIYRGLIEASYGANQPDEGLGWFRKLVAAGQASAWDWSGEGDRYKKLGDFGRAGAFYQESAETGFGVGWESFTLGAWCDAADMYQFAKEADDALAAARKCVELGAGKDAATAQVAEAHSDMSEVFAQRGLYSEALDEAQRASSLEPTDAWYFDDIAQALIGLQRYMEAVSAAQSALRLSDGKYARMHFTLGSAHFQLKNWKLAESSFERAARLDGKEPAAAYNAALCFQYMSDYSDAVTWYREYLRRAPSAKDKQQVAARIALLTGGVAAPAAATQGSCSPAIESQIDGDFEGWSGETLFKLENGQIWEQAEYDYEYEYAYMPDVLIYQAAGGCKLSVSGMDDTILVRRIK